MLVEKLIAAVEAKVNDRPLPRIYASNVGSCVRKLWYVDKLVDPEPLSGRSGMVFDMGNRVEDAIISFLVQAKIPHVRTSEERDKVFMKEIGSNVKPDFFFETEVNGKPTLVPVDVKSMSDFAFQRAESNDIDRTYLAQMECYLRAYSVNYGLFVCYRKETSHLCEVMVQRDDRLWRDILAAVATARGDIVPSRPYELEEKCEGCEGTGKTAVRKQAHKACAGTGQLPGGPFIPNFPCGYCQYKIACWGDLEMAFLNEKPRWRIAGTGGGDTNGQEEGQAEAEAGGRQGLLISDDRG